MKQYLKHHEWHIIEEGLDPHYNKISESVFSIGNGRMGQRANFEEEYSGETLRGSYVAGVYYPDKTRVGWWKNGYPEYFAKVLNAPNWIGIHITIDNQKLDLAKCKVEDFRRVLDMKTGLLSRSFAATLPDGKKVKVESKRFCSMANGEVGAIRYAITPLNFTAKTTLSLYVDADVVNKDSNYDEKFWEEVNKEATEGRAIVTAQTKKTFFHVTTGMQYVITNDGKKATFDRVNIELREKYAGNVIQLDLQEGKELVVYKYAAVLSSENHAKDALVTACAKVLTEAVAKGFDALFEDHARVWAHKWDGCDITIEGDIAAQQGIRFNIFQLTQTYTGEDERLNIGPKGFTGEKYGGSTYWDTEAYCLPFFLGTAEEKVARNLLVYRYKHLERAIENAGKLGFKDGAALYPMVTMNGEECHNEWEITFEEIHRNGAIAFAIFDYIRYTGDDAYLAEFGLEVLLGISRFWSQRITWSSDRNRFVMLGVTGPNEYENNVNNNWYTNTIATWTLQYTLDALNLVGKSNPSRLAEIIAKTNFKETTETHRWREIIAKMHYPHDEKRGVYLQQDGFLDKELLRVSDLGKDDRPINQKWSWDRILRSCFIKQADVLQGIFLFEERYDIETIRRNFDFYEPMTVHESSLSPCVHVILASKLGYKERAYEFYLRTSRLDLDDYNNDTEDGCHITSMAGTWMSIVKGFGGMTVKDGTLHFNPFTPDQWKSYSFRLEFRGRVIKVKISTDAVETELETGEPLEIFLHGKPVLLKK
ncbi:glycoside hydrolase family 65 protein [Chryseolinea lacunae]|uniref:Glycoside hydrolase family 65 protein n=1 Tax=Chryseolinea lacunae TaxID=2801331 RepID=A0ABS1KWE5_9BACT|nr:glycoside hydrolase family 65 protein [Chryseolinea lacunae]MBL0743633.1 glycoside hydrolase family 65 protein [Chryseolinea lacunae]